MFGELGKDDKGWGITTLGECCELNPKRPRDIDDELLVSFVPMPAVSEDGKIDCSDIKPYKEVRKGFTYFAENDVLFAKITPCMENGKGAVAKGLEGGIGSGSTEFHVLRPIAGKSNPYWLYILTMFESFRVGARKVMTGTGGQLRVPIGYLNDYPITLPPIDLQDRFEEFVHQSDKSKFVRFKSQFIEMFGLPESNVHGFEIGTIGDVVKDVHYGTAKKASEDGKYIYIRMNNITYEGELDLSDIKRIDVPDKELAGCIVQQGDVLFNRTNSKDLVGKTCYFSGDEPMIIAGYIIRLRMNGKVIPEYLSIFMNLDRSKKLLYSMAKGAVGQANINAQEVQSIEIVIPPDEMQKEFLQLLKQSDKSK